MISTNDHTFIILNTCNGNISLGVEVFCANHFNGAVKVITVLEGVSDELGDLVVSLKFHQHILSQTFGLIISWEPSIHSNGKSSCFHSRVHSYLPCEHYGVKLVHTTLDELGLIRDSSQFI
jgi:hypothetical protein